jgi:hypothetical protein
MNRTNKIFLICFILFCGIASQLQSYMQYRDPNNFCPNHAAENKDILPLHIEGTIDSMVGFNKSEWYFIKDTALGYNSHLVLSNNKKLLPREVYFELGDRLYKPIGTDTIQVNRGKYTMYFVFCGITYHSKKWFSGEVMPFGTR